MTTGFRDSLRDELIRAAHRRQRQVARQRRVIQGVAAVAVLLLAAAVLLRVDRPRAAAAGVEIDVVDGRIEVTLTDVEARPNVIARALADAGIDADVEAVPAGPSQLGRFVGLFADPGDLRPLEEKDGTFAGFSIPEGWDGVLKLEVGAPADAGEPYERPANAFAAGEPLACSGLFGATLADAARADELAGLDVRVVSYSQGVAEKDVIPLAHVTATRGSWYVVEAHAESADDLSLVITPDGSPIPGHPTVEVAAC